MSKNNQLDRILEKNRKIVEKSANGEYLYRGESACYDKVSSGLYRKYHELAKNKDFDIEDVQRQILEAAKEFIRQTGEIDDFEILTQLQHYGYPTNLIDFTTDIHIALFFACYRNFDKNGRIILLHKTNSDILKPKHILEPQHPVNRVISQKSIFVRPSKGFIKPKKNETVIIDSCLKPPLLDHLRQYHGITAETIYNDLHGFIRYDDLHQSANTEFYAGLVAEKVERNPKIKHYNKAIKHYNKAIELNPQMDRAYNNRGIVKTKKAIELNPQMDRAYNNRGIVKTQEKMLDSAINDFKKAIELKPNYTRAYKNRGNTYLRKGKLDSAIDDFNKAIKLKQDDPDAYNNRGNAYLRKGKLDSAIDDFNKAIELKPDHAAAHFNRSMHWLRLEDWESARSDLKVTKDLEIKIIKAFRADYQSVEKFEQKYDVQLPKDIKAML